MAACSEGLPSILATLGLQIETDKDPLLIGKIADDFSDRLRQTPDQSGQRQNLVIGGELDGQDFPKLAKHIADTIPGAELVILPKLGHIPHLESPDAFYRELMRFLR